jgi:exosome complex component CSL4
MSRQAKIEGAFVVPGERLGVVEEFLPGSGTYEQDGTIYAVRTGLTSFDPRNRVVSVKPKTHVPIFPVEGATVVGTVTLAHDKMATLRLARIDGTPIQNTFTGILHISSSSPRYERRMSDVCKAGDVIRAKVIDVSNRVPLLTTAGRGLGVILAYCSWCGGTLELKNRRLECSSCKNVERRRMADDYGNLSA